MDELLLWDKRQDRISSWAASVKIPSVRGRREVARNESQTVCWWNERKIWGDLWEVNLRSPFLWAALRLKYRLKKEPSESEPSWFNGGQWLHRVWTKSLSHTLNVCVESRWDHKLVDGEEHRWGLKDKGLGWGEGGPIGAMKEGLMEKGGAVFAFRVSLTRSNSSRQGNLCGQRIPWGSDMCSYWEHSVQVRKMQWKKTNTWRCTDSS